MWAWRVTGHRSPPPFPRGRHAPPLEVRLEVQRERLFEAAAAVFSRVGYAEASAEAISREAGMSKATFYEHFANKEECLLALFDDATSVRLARDRRRRRAAPAATFEARLGAGLRAFLERARGEPAMAQTLLVEIIGAGPRRGRAARRDPASTSRTPCTTRRAHAAARTARAGLRLARRRVRDRRRDVELVSRQLRTGQPERHARPRSR